jgi:hypothetical protein
VVVLVLLRDRNIVFVICTRLLIRETIFQTQILINDDKIIQKALIADILLSRLIRISFVLEFVEHHGVYAKINNEFLQDLIIR